MKIILTCLLIPAATVACGFTFTETEFLTGTWNSVENRPTGGNPGSWGFVAPTGGSTFSVAHFSRVAPMTYNPSVSGAITSLRFGSDYMRLGTGSESLGLYATQGGQTYYCYYASVTSPNGVWRNGTINSASAGDFNPFMFGSGHPDFSATGSQITFGIAMQYVNEFPATFETGIDNFLLTTEPVPEPVSLASVVLGLACITFRRRGGRLNARVS
jgi:hypothetical protein